MYSKVKSTLNAYTSCNKLGMVTSLLTASMACSFTVQAASCDALAAPTNVNVINNTGTAVTFSWNEVQGAQSYQLVTYVNGAYQHVTSTTNQATFSNLAGDYYYFGVFPYNACDERGTMSEWVGVEVSGESNCTIPNVPQNLIATDEVIGGFTARWDASTDAQSYHIQKMDQGAWTSVAEQALSSYQFTGLAQGSASVRVSAKNNCGESAFSNVLNVEVIGSGCPSQLDDATLLDAKNITSDGFTFTWQAVKDAAQYDVQRWVDGQWVTEATTTSTEFVFTSLAQLSTQYVRVVAKTDCGQPVTSTSQWITVQLTPSDSCPVVIGEPTALSAANISATAFTLNWQKANGADNYDVQLWNNGQWVSQGSTTDATMHLDNFSPNSIQYTRVVAGVSCDSRITANSGWIQVKLEDGQPVTLEPVTGVIAFNQTETSFDISWQTVKDAQYYSVQTLVNGYWSTVDTTTSTQFTVTGLAPGSEQTVRILAHNGNAQSESQPVTVQLKADCPSTLTAPNGLNLTANADDAFTASWQSVTGAKSYRVEYAHNGAWSVVGTQPELSKSFTNRSEGTHRVRIAAVCGNVVSPTSAVKTIELKKQPEPQCNLPDVEQGMYLDTSAGGTTLNSHAGYMNVVAAGGNYDPNNHNIRITCPAKYVDFSHKPNSDGTAWFKVDYSYSHFGQRQSNQDTVQIEVTSNGAMARRTFNIDLSQLGTVEHPVKPYCDNLDIDNDQDGIPDCAEEPGKTFFTMPVYEWGARKNQRDVFIEVDYMAKEDSGDVGTEPRKEALDKVKEVFAQRGYTLHFDAGNLYGQGPENYNMGGGEPVRYSPWIGLSDWRNIYTDRHAVPGMKDDETNWPGVFSYMPTYFDNRPERSRLFYYALFASSQAAGGAGSSGQAPDYFDNYFYVSLGSPVESPANWEFSTATAPELNRLINSQASVLMHEFGHVLGLSHGGFPDNKGVPEPNFKANYNSVMNYMYALSGVPKNGAMSKSEMISDRVKAAFMWNQSTMGQRCRDSLWSKYQYGTSRRTMPQGLNTDWREFNLDFSDGNHADLSESNYVEANTVGGVDLDCDGMVSNSTRSGDLNEDTQYSNMRDYNDWDNIYLYHRYFNYTPEGKFLLSGLGDEDTMRGYIEPADVVPGAIAAERGPGYMMQQRAATKDKNARPIGIPETPMHLVTPQ